MQIKCAALALAMLALVALLPISSEADTGGVAYYGPGWDWMSLCLTHESWGESVGCVPADYWCVKPGYIPGQWLTVSANGASIDCEIGDTVQDYDVDAWLSHNVIELSWEAFIALGMPSSASVGAPDVEQQPAPEPDAPGEACFSETGHCVRLGFFAYWSANGGVRALGLPLTDEFRATDTGLVTQVFERVVLEWQPADGEWAIRGRRITTPLSEFVPEGVEVQ
jgi:hypothetical protein